MNYAREKYLMTDTEIDGIVKSDVYKKLNILFDTRIDEFIAMLSDTSCYRDKYKITDIAWNLSMWCDIECRCNGIFDDKDNQGEEDPECLLFKYLFIMICNNISNIIVKQDKCCSLQIDIRDFTAIKDKVFNSALEADTHNSYNGYNFIDFFGNDIDYYIDAMTWIILTNDKMKQLCETLYKILNHK